MMWPSGMAYVICGMAYVICGTVYKYNVAEYCSVVLWSIDDRLSPVVQPILIDVSAAPASHSQFEMFFIYQEDHIYSV